MTLFELVMVIVVLGVGGRNLPIPSWDIPSSVDLSKGGISAFGGGGLTILI